MSTNMNKCAIVVGSNCQKVYQKVHRKGMIIVDSISSLEEQERVPWSRAFLKTAIEAEAEAELPCYFLTFGVEFT